MDAENGQLSFFLYYKYQFCFVTLMVTFHSPYSHMFGWKKIKSRMSINVDVNKNVKFI